MEAVATLPEGDRLPEDHPAPHEGSIDHPGAWYGPDLQDRDDWKYPLSETERAELRAATRHALDRRKDIKDIARADFPLPALGPRLESLRQEVINGRGFVLIRGMPIENLPFREAAAMYWGLGAWFGNARSQNTRGHLLGHVIDISDRFENKSERGYLTNRHLAYHCDSVDVVGLMCLQKAKEGGCSSIVSSYTIHNEMWRRRPELARALYGPIPRDRRDEIPPGKGPWYELPVFNYHKGRLAISYLRKFIDMAQRYPEARRIGEDVVAALDMVSELANEPALHLTMQFEPGDIQILHNHQILHDRTAYEDWPEEHRKRYLLRLWLSPPDGIPLPEAFAGRYNSVTVGDRGGVAIPGLETRVPLTPM